MLNCDLFTRIVDKINIQYGTEHFLPAEYVWQDHVHYIKAFGKMVWDSDNCDSESESTIYYLCDNYIQKYILVNIWKQQVECIKDETLWKLRDVNADEGLIESFEDYFENEIIMLKGEYN